MVTSLQKSSSAFQEAINLPINELMLPNEYTENEYRPFITPTAPDYYGQSYWRDMVDHWTLQWQGAVQYGINNDMGIFENDESWNPLDENRNPYFNELKKYEQHIEDLAMTRSQTHFEYVKGRLDEKYESKQRLEYSDRWTPGFLTGMANPLYLIPLPATMGVGIARGFAKAGGMMFGIMSAEEALYHTYDPTRTARESAMAIGTGTIIGGLIGGGFGAFGKATKTKFNSKSVDDIGQKFDNEHAKIEGKVGSPWDNVNVKPHSSNINKANTLSFVQKVGNTVRVVFDGKRLIKMFDD